MKKKYSVLTIAVATALVALSGCGGGGGGGGDPTGTTSTLSGTAASGAAIVGTVQVTDSKGATKRVNIGANGGYSIDISGMTAPFILLAEGTVGAKTVKYYAPAVAEDINKNINITPLSDLMLANIAGDLAANCAASTACISALTKAGIDTAASNLATRLAPTLAAMGLDASTDLLRAPLTGGSHTGVDALLDVLDVTVDTATKIATIKNIGAGTSVTDNLASNADDSAVLPAGGGSGPAPIDLVAAIKARLAEMDAILASSDTAATKTANLTAFCTSDFLWDGRDCATMMSGAPTDGWTFSSHLDQVAKFDTAGVDSVDPSGTMDDQHVGTVFTDDNRFGLLWRKSSTDNKFYLAGDQLTGRYRIRASAAWDASASTGSSFINVEALPTNASGAYIADTVTVTGPGLIAAADFVPNPYSTHSFSRANGNNLIADTEYTLADVQAAVASKAPYTFTVKNGGSTVATYKRTLVSDPLVSGSLTESMFARVSNVPDLSLCKNGGTWMPAYVRTGGWIGGTHIICGDNASNSQEVSVEDQEATSALAIPAMPSATWLRVGINSGSNSNGRNFYWYKQITQ